MVGENAMKEKREFLRYDYDKPLHYNIVRSLKDKKIPAQFGNATSKNLSASGLLFTTGAKSVPALSSYLLIDLDYRTAAICKEIEARVLMVDNKILGRVVRIDDNEDDTCGVGIAFVTKQEIQKKTVEDLIS
ncbi:MAG: PilZ domain-containing protein [Candidatus Omnitrophica bacterium]|nr:PilZ domain-containing protein [Candidatus Omnitrophota bacterium]